MNYFFVKNERIFFEDEVCFFRGVLELCGLDLFFEKSSLFSPKDKFVDVSSAPLRPSDNFKARW